MPGLEGEMGFSVGFATKNRTVEPRSRRVVERLKRQRFDSVVRENPTAIELAQRKVGLIDLYAATARTVVLNCSH